MKNRNVPDENIAAELETDRLISPAWCDCITGIWISERTGVRRPRNVCQRIVLFLSPRLIAAPHQAFSPDSARTEDRYIIEVLSPDQTVMPVTVTKVLIRVPLIRFRQVILRGFGRSRGDDCRSLIKIESNITFQMNRNREIGSRWKQNRAASGLRGCVDRLIDCGSIKCLAVTFGAKSSHAVSGRNPGVALNTLRGGRQKLRRQPPK